MSSHLRPLLLTFIILHLSLDILHAAPPPELTVLRQQYDKVLAERVTAVHEALVGDLNTKFTAALDNAIAQAKSAGDLPTVLAIQGDKKLLSEKQPLPVEDAEGTPGPLNKLRTIYRAQLAKLTEQRTANAAALLMPYTAKLQQLEAVLTKNDRVEEAKTVMDYRMALAANAQVPAPVVVKMEAPVPSPMPVAVDLPKRDDRKAAEWILEHGGEVQVTGAVGKVTTLAGLPKGRFEVTQIALIGLPHVDDAEFDRLAHLDSLVSIKVSGIDQGDAAFRFIGSCPQVATLDIQNWKNCTGAWLRYLAPLKGLRSITVVGAAPADVTGLADLQGAGLLRLNCRGAAVDDAALAVIAGFRNLKYLGLRHTKVTDAGMVQLTPLTSLISLDVSETEVSPQGLGPLSVLKIEDLGFGSLAQNAGPAVPELGRIFPKLTGFEYGPGGSAGPISADSLHAVARAWPRLRDLRFQTSAFFDADACASIATLLPELEEVYLWSTKITDAQLAGFADCKKLRQMNLELSPISDASLSHLARMKSLKTLHLGKTKITPAALATFKKTRPDVTVK